MPNLNKRRLLKAAQNQIGMCQEDYVSMLKRVTGKTSSTELNATQIDKVLSEFKRLGYRPNNRNQRLISKISYLWMLLGEAGKLDNPTKAAMLVFCNRFTKSGVYKADVKQLHAVIEALKDWCEREGVEVKSGLNTH